VEGLPCSPPDWSASWTGCVSDGVVSSNEGIAAGSTPAGLASGSDCAGDEGIAASPSKSVRVVGGSGTGVGVLTGVMGAACDGAGIAPVSQVQIAGIAETGDDIGKSGVVEGEGKAEKDRKRGDSWKSSSPSLSHSSYTSYLRLAALLVRLAGGKAKTAGDVVSSGCVDRLFCRLSSQLLPPLPLAGWGGCGVPGWSQGATLRYGRRGPHTMVVNCKL
jgi:hypothetical protein